MKKYQIIYADPPWDYPEGFPTQSRTPGKWVGKVKIKAIPYLTMTLQEIYLLPISNLTDKNCRLFLWTTNRYLPFAFEVMKGWGFQYKQTMIWHKSDGNMGGSIAPNSAEFLLVGIKGKPKVVSKLKSAIWKFPQSKKHSTKPKEFREIIKQTSGGNAIELFAREKVDGWDVWGNEVESDINLINK
jgi:N6-adenosine-specific RNA methylase IME4